MNFWLPGAMAANVAIEFEPCLSLPNEELIFILEIKSNVSEPVFHLKSRWKLMQK